MECKYCGYKTYEDDVKFCPGCGKTVDAEPQITEKSEEKNKDKDKKKSKKIAIIVGVVVAVVILLVSLVAIFHEPIVEVFEEVGIKTEEKTSEKDKENDNKGGSGGKKDPVDLDGDGVIEPEEGEGDVPPENGENNNEEIIPEPPITEDELIEEEQKPETGSDSKTEAEKRIKAYDDLIKSNNFTIRATMKQKNGRTVEEFPMLYVKNGADFCIEAVVPMEENKSVTARMICLNNKMYCSIPSMNVYYVVEDDELGGDDFGMGTFDDMMEYNSSFVGTSTVNLNGKSYVCDIYEVDGETHKYYYDSDNRLVRIEEIESANSYTIVDIIEMSPKADTSKIKKPSGVNITNMMK